MKNLVLYIMLLIFSGCALFESRLSVTDADLAFTLANMEIDTGGVPGTPKLDAEACMMLIRNADKLTSDDLKEVLEKLRMETGDCSFGAAGTNIPTAESNTGIRRQ